MSEVSRSFDTLQPHGGHAILQAKILDRVAFPFSKELPNPGTEPKYPASQVDSLPAEPQGKPKNIYRIYTKNSYNSVIRQKTKTDF